MAKNIIELGDRVKDKITGLEGIVVGRTQWIHGCDTISVQPEGLDKESKPIGRTSFDEGQVVITKKRAYKMEEPKAEVRPGGPRPEPKRPRD